MPPRSRGEQSADRDMQEWDIESHLRMADKLNIVKSYLSISSPGVHLVPDDHELARKISRECNTVAADAKKRFPERFGFWASLPLPDVEGSLQEVAYAFDELQCDGVAVASNIHGYYLGHHDFEPVWAELNRRHAIVFVHPTSGCTHNEGVDKSQGSRSATPLSEYPNPIFEFFFDTARALISLFYSGAIARYPNITYIIPHAGGCLPPLIDRFSIFGAAIPGLPVDKSVTPNFVQEKLKTNFYFDMAGTAWPNQIPALLPFIEKRQVLYGSDYPFTPAIYVEQLAESMKQHLPSVFKTEEEEEMAYSGNAKQLFRDHIAAVRTSI